MQMIGNFKTIKPFALMLLAAIFSMGVLNFVVMDHGMDAADACPLASQTRDCSEPVSPSSCFKFQINILNQLQAGIPCAKQFSVLPIVVAVIATLVLAGFDRLARNFLVIRHRFRHLFENCTARFFKQLGNWLSLLTKDFPALQIFYAKQV